MSVSSHNVIGPRRHVTLAYQKKGRFPWATFLNIFPLWNPPDVDDHLSLWEGHGQRREACVWEGVALHNN